MNDLKIQIEKKICFFYVFVTIFLCLINTSNCVDSTDNSILQDDTVLILNMENQEVLPIHFRTCKNPFLTYLKFTKSSPSKTGLEQLNASGSSQFSEKSLLSIIQKLGNLKELTIVDLRQESHGFANGLAVSWYSNSNWANINKTAEEIRADESARLQKLLEEKNVIIYNFVKKRTGELFVSKIDPIQEQITSVSTEKAFVEKQNLNYFRVFATDHKAPSVDNIDAFVLFAKNLSNDAWLHFHCQEGQGRTTSFLCIYDIMKNSKNVSFEDIINRQYLLGGSDLFATEETPYPNDAKDRIETLSNFYDYCKTNQDNFTTLFSQFKPVF